jgi:hypothetical protein
MARKEGMKPIHILVSEVQRRQIAKFAKGKKYKTTVDYIRTLIENDMNADGEGIDLTVDRGGYRYPTKPEEWKLAEQEADEDLAAGNYRDFDSMEAFLADLMDGDDE